MRFSTIVGIFTVMLTLVSGLVNELGQYICLCSFRMSTMEDQFARKVC